MLNCDVSNLEQYYQNYQAKHCVFSFGGSHLLIIPSLSTTFVYLYTQILAPCVPPVLHMLTNVDATFDWLCGVQIVDALMSHSVSRALRATVLIGEAVGPLCPSLISRWDHCCIASSIALSVWLCQLCQRSQRIGPSQLVLNLVQTRLVVVVPSGRN